MNALKSIFITTYISAISIVTGFAIWAIFQGSADALSWIGVLLATGPLAAVIGWITVFRSHARTSARFPILNAAAIAGVIMAAWRLGEGSGSVLTSALAAAGWLGLVLYVYWGSSFGGRKPSARIGAGAMLPAFSVVDTAGRPVTSEELTQSGPAILIFFRGNWCPLCMAHIKEVARSYRELEERGARVALISSQPHGKTKQLARKFDVKFDFLTDTGNRASRLLGISQSHGLPFGIQVLGYKHEVTMPTVIITEKGGRILWSDETDNYRVSPEPATFLDVLSRHQHASGVAHS